MTNRAAADSTANRAAPECTATSDTVTTDVKDNPAPLGYVALQNDPGLAFAARALEPAHIAPPLAAGLRERLGPHTLRRAELLRHKPGRRALISYTLEHPARHPPERCAVLGKVRAKGTDAKTHALQSFLWENGFDDASPDRVSVAEPLGVLEAFHMTLQRRVPGTNLSDLLRPGAEPLLERVADAIFKLHRTPAPGRRRHTLSDELTILQRQLDAVSAAEPTLEGRISRVLAACKTLADGLPDAKPVTLHRDFYPEQLLLGGERLYLLDLDLCAYGDPALDIGNFAAHLREFALRTFGDAAALTSLEVALCRRYCARAGVPAASVEVYTALSLARHIAISRRIPARRHLSGALLALSERCLGKALRGSS